MYIKFTFTSSQFLAQVQQYIFHLRRLYIASSFIVMCSKCSHYLLQWIFLHTMFMHHFKERCKVNLLIWKVQETLELNIVSCKKALCWYVCRNIITLFLFVFLGMVYLSKVFVILLFQTKFVFVFLRSSIRPSVISSLIVKSRSNLFLDQPVQCPSNAVEFKYLTNKVRVL